MHMPYFERKPDAEDTRRFSALPEEGEPGGGLFSHSGDDRFDDDYDDEDELINGKKSED